mgnify:CR=1 FL=1
MIETTERVVAPGTTSAGVMPMQDVGFGMIFRQTLRDNVTGILTWGIGYSALIALVVLLYPILESNNTLLGVVRGLGLLGGANNALNPQNLASFGGYLSVEALTWAPLVLSVYVIPQALNAVAREEERGTLDILLSTPLPRWRLLTEKAMAIVVSVLAILGIMLLTLIVTTQATEGVDFPISLAVAGIWHIFPILLAILAAALLLSVTVRSSRAAGGWAALFVVGSYFVRALGDLYGNGVDWLHTLSQFSIFGYYRSITVLNRGVQWNLDLPLLVTAAVLFVLALIQFRRRDIGV